MENHFTPQTIMEVEFTTCVVFENGNLRGQAIHFQD